jgi:hypothetical protein
MQSDKFPVTSPCFGTGQKCGIEAGKILCGNALVAKLFQHYLHVIGMIS